MTEGATKGTTAAEDAVVVRAICKRFGGFAALDDVDVTIKRGQVHGFVGANGAGKSTLLGLIAGRLAPTSGRIETFGIRIEPGDPRAARAGGVAAIYQELTIAPALSAAANMFLGRETHSRGRLREAKMRNQFRVRAEELGVEIDPAATAATLSVADQQMVEIMRALDCEARLLLLDEPTSALGFHERQALFRVMRQLREAGVTMVLVSHDLDEILEICDEVTVFRDGETVATDSTRRWNKGTLVRAMLGETADTLGELRPHGRDASAVEASLLEVRDLTSPGLRRPASFRLRPNEVLGIAGLVGSGRSSLLRAIAGAERRAGGEMTLEGKVVRVPRSPRKALDLGIALITEDRGRDGIVPARTASDNMILSDYTDVSRFGFVARRRVREGAAELGRRVSLAAHRLNVPAGQLSGGNQQKLLAARWLHRRPRLLLADEPTRGIDVGAKSQILTMLQDLAGEGVGVIVASSEFEELIEICNRILVLSFGEIVGEFENSGELTEGEILDLAFRVEEAV